MRKVKKYSINCLLIGLLACGQAMPQAAADRESIAVTFREGSTINVRMGSTGRLPEASGEASVRRRLGVTEINLELSGHEAGHLFPGRFQHLCVLDHLAGGDSDQHRGTCASGRYKSRLTATTLLTSFAMFVTAEPHFLADKPSRLVILENTATGLENQKTATTETFQYQDFETDYEYEIASLAAEPETEGKLRSDRYQAIVAVRFADEAFAEQFAPELFAAAREALSQLQQGFAQGLNERQISLLAHRTVRLAVEARRLAEERSAEAALEAERRNHKEDAARLTQASEQAQAAAALWRAEEGRARQATEAARKETESVREKLLNANQEADRLARLRAEAESEARSAQDQATAVYARLEGALSRVAETRETERGLSVNLPDILFATGKSELRISTREVLSRIGGILLVAPEYRLSIEGHTDSVGRTQYNLKLSQERAQRVRDYLVEAHISPALITARGYGESKPVASNQTADGRQKNRRVEIVIEGLLK